MKHGSLFNGIGGFQLAAEMLEWENVFSCEIDKWCSEKTKIIFKDCIQHGDIKQTDFTIYRGRIDVLSGGDPCQPHSIAGLGKGKDDVRYLWPEYFRSIREIAPAWVVNENVNGSVANGILDLKIDDLESEGYTCQAYDIPAEAVGALHQRSRIWLVAYNADFDAANRKPGAIPFQEKQKKLQERNNLQHFSEPVDLRFNNPYTNGQRLKEQHFSEKPELLPEGLSRYFGFSPYAYGNIKRDEIKSGIIRMLNGLPEGVDYPERNKRIKALGNAIVWQVAYEIFKAINNKP